MTAKCALILDLDDTLVDTGCLAVLRNERAWKECVRRIGETSVFPGLREVLDELRARRVSVGIVTASVSYYARAVLKHHGIASDALVAFHDCSPRKPHPAPIQLCLKLISASPDEAAGLGDADIDATAYRAAGVISLGAGWSPSVNHAQGWDAVLGEPHELLNYF